LGVPATAPRARRDGASYARRRHGAGPVFRVDTGEALR